MRGSKYLSLAAVSLLLAIMASLPLRAQRKRPGRSRPAVARLERTLLWEISGNGLPSPSYLYGTMHVTDKRAFDFGDSVLLKLRSCAIFASEVELDSAIREVFRMYMEGDADEDAADDDDDAGGGYAGDGSPVTVADSAVMLPSTGDSIMSAMLPDDSAMAATPESDPFPIAVAVPDTVVPDTVVPTKRRGLRGNPLANDFFRSASEPRPDDKPVILDAYLFRLAKHEGKRVVGLELVDEQINAFSDISFSDVWKFYLKQGTRKRKRVPLSTDPEKLQAMILDYYERGDLDGIHSFFVDNWPPVYYDALLTNRNHHMADRAVPYMMQGSTFIAVGAGHLPGDNGLIDLFRKKGYTVRPVQSLHTGLAATYVEGSVREPWHDLAPPAGAFSISMPAEPIDISALISRYQESSRDERGRAYLWPDLGSGITYIAGYADYPHNYLLSYDPESFLDNVGDGTTEPSYADRKLLRKIVVDGLPGRERELPGDDNRVKRVRTVLRGNRLYRLVVEAAPELARSADAERFLGSFRLTPIRREPWREYRDSGFSVLVPAFPYLSTNVEGPYGNMGGVYRPMEQTMARALDSNSGRFYQVEREIYGSYYEVKDSAELLDRALGGLKLRRDSILTDRTIMQDGVPAREIEGLRPGGLAAYRVRLVLRGDHLYKLWVELPASELHDSLTSLFFDSFHLGSDSVGGDVFSSKASRILDDLSSTDTTRRARAAMAARYYTGFGVEHLPRLYELIDRSYPDDGDEDGGTRVMLLRQLGELRDSATVPFLRRVAASDSGAPGVRNALLSALADIPTRDAAELLIDMMLDTAVADDPSRAHILYYVGTDSASLRPLFPRILGLLDRDAYRPSLYRLIATAIDSGALEPAALIPHGDTIVADLRATLRARAENDPDDEESWAAAGRLQWLVECAGHLAGRPELVPLLEKALGDSDADIRLAATVALLRKDRPIPPAVLSDLAADPMERVTLYGRLEGMGRLDLFPREKMTQKDIAEGLLVAWIDEDDELSADSLRFLAEREVTIDGAPGRVFLFAFRGVESDGWMVGISGPQPVERERIALTGGKTRTDYDALEDMSIDEHFRTLLSDP